MMPKHRWRDMPTSAFGEGAADWIAVLPLAAIEHHGPHLPVGVDAMIAEGMVDACIEALPPELPVTFLPTQEVAKSNEHIRFPGTLTLDWDLAIRSWIAIGQSVGRAGPRTLVLITSHGGNAAAMDVVARELRVTENLRVVTTSWGRLGAWQDIYQYDGPITDIHGGLSETSLMLALRPDLVDMTKAEAFGSDQSRMDARSKLGWHGAKANMAWVAEDLNAEGVVGDASSADANLGRKDIDKMVEGFIALMRDLVEETQDRGPLT